MVQIFVATIAMFLLSRLALWLLRGLGDDARRIFAAHAAALATATLIGGYDLRHPQTGLHFLIAFVTFGLPTTAWVVFDLMLLHGRRHPPPVVDE